MNAEFETIKYPRHSPSLAFARLDFNDVYAVWQRNARVYLRLWKMEMAAPLIEPFFSIIAFGWGVGSLIASRVEGIPYLAFVGAGVLCFTVVSRALFELSYGAYFRMVYQSTYDAILATPISAESLAFAEILWGVTKSTIDAIVILIVLFAFGAVSSPFALLVPIALIAGSTFVAAVTLGVTAHTHDIDSYNLYLAIYFSIIFVCGAWFPVEVLPSYLRMIAWSIPITGTIDLARALLTGRFLTRHIYEAIYIIVASLVAIEWAMRSLRRRMVS
jgi:lipooligosaccharide transport system permease protein